MLIVSHVFSCFSCTATGWWNTFESEHCVCLTLLLTVIRDTWYASTPLLLGVDHFGVEPVLGSLNHFLNWWVVLKSAVNLPKPLLAEINYVMNIDLLIVSAQHSAKKEQFCALEPRSQTLCRVPLRFSSKHLRLPLFRHGVLLEKSPKTNAHARLCETIKRSITQYTTWSTFTSEICCPHTLSTLTLVSLYPHRSTLISSPKSRRQHVQLQRSCTTTTASLHEYIMHLDILVFCRFIYLCQCIEHVLFGMELEVEVSGGSTTTTSL